MFLPDFQGAIIIYVELREIHINNTEGAVFASKNYLQTQNCQ